ncbi:MAG: serine/threonine protein kinase [Ramlibacter sp.]|nr:serine/threonine protein kinase [Ramlibacter sp.]
MSEMTPEQFALLKTLFAETSEMPPATRRARLEQLTDDATLLEEALALARENDAMATADAGQSVFTQAGAELKVGDSLGAWKLLEEIGHGGMGAVILAERDDGHFKQTSAIKILKGRSSPEKLALLTKERQILASLSHPNIARLLDGGATPEGRPYLVMEYVEGMPIDAYCQSKHLATRRRLGLFLGVCDTIAFAHQRLVVHCDIKPGNVLVDRRGRLVLLDFGISRLVSEVTAAAGAGGLAFTPGYASPEQRAGEPVGTASDVFSLGRLLETIVADASETKLNWELARIIQKATAAAPADRYASVFLLAEDVQRYLDQVPLRAVPATWWYQLQKFAGRRPTELIVVVVFLLVIGVFVHRVNQERNDAVLARKHVEVQRDRALQAEAEAIRQRDLARAQVTRGTRP